MEVAPLQKEQPRYPTILQAFGLAVINLGFLYLFSLGLFVFLGNTLPQTAVFLLGYGLAMSATLYIGKGFRRRTLGQLPKFFKKINLKAVALIILATIVLDIGIVLPLCDFIPVSDFFKKSMIHNFGNLDSFMFIAMIFGAPFFEEYIFRGLILDGLLKNYAPWLAILVSSLLFGAIHINPIQFISASLGGLFLGWIYYKSNNLTYCAIIHFVINLMGFFTIKYVGIEQVFEKGFIELCGGMRNALTIFGVSVVSFIACIYYLNKLFQDKNQTT